MRINVFKDSGDYAEQVLDGWYESSRARRWSDRDYNGSGSGGVGRGEALIRTAGGRWVLETWTHWQGEEDYHRFVDDAKARNWLLRHEFDDAVEELFGEVEEEVGPGRPEIGPQIVVRMPEEMTARLDERAKAAKKSRAALIRQAVTNLLDAE